MTATSGEYWSMHRSVCEGIRRTEKILTRAEQLIGHSHELRSLYKNLGYDHYLYKRALEIVVALKSLSQTTIPQATEACRHGHHPSDSVSIRRCIELLGELERLVKDYWTLPHPEDLQSALGNIAALREDLPLALRAESQREERSPWLSQFGLDSLAGNVAWWLFQALSDTKKEQLDDLLSELINIRRDYGPERVPIDGNQQRKRHRALQIVAELRSLLEASIPDFPAFQKMFDQESDEAYTGNPYADLLKAVWRARNDHQQVVAILNTALVNAAVGLPMELDKIVKIWPADSARVLPNCSGNWSNWSKGTGFSRPG